MLFVCFLRCCRLFVGFRSAARSVRLRRDRITPTSEQQQQQTTRTKQQTKQRAPYRRITRERDKHTCDIALASRLSPFLSCLCAPLRLVSSALSVRRRRSPSLNNNQRAGQQQTHHNTNRHILSDLYSHRLPLRAHSFGVECPPRVVCLASLLFPCESSSLFFRSHSS